MTDERKRLLFELAKEREEIRELLKQVIDALTGDEIKSVTDYIRGLVDQRNDDYDTEARRDQG
jgi:hypothetical protein